MKHQPTTNNSLLRLLGLALLLSCFTAFTTNAQTPLISPSGDGGFENGSTFAANNWILVNGTPTSTLNQWIIGPSSTSGVGTGNSAYITNNTTTSAYAYTNNSAQYIVHFYRDITFPAGETNITLSFDWKGVGETSAYDGLQVSIAPTSVTPTAAATAPSGTVSTAIVAGATFVGNALYFNQSTATNTVISIPASLAGNCSSSSTLRLIFTFRMDGSVGTSPATAIDNISLTSSTPTITSAGGTFTINNTLPTSGTNFQTFSAAISAANSATACGALTGPITFNVSAGQTFSENVPALTASGSSALNYIRFLKSGAGANPKITPTGSAGSADFAFCVSGGDFITIDGIDLDASAGSAVEYGLLVRNASSTNGAQNNTFQNMVINQGTRGGSNTSYGILQTVSSTGGGVTPTSAGGANSTNKYYNLTVTNVRDGGIYLLGNTSFPDLACEIGTSACATRNTISNVGPTSTTFSGAFGMRADAQSGFKIFNNNVTAIAGNQSATRGIYVLTNAGNSEIYRNQVWDVSVFGSTTTTSSCYGIQTENLTTGTNNIKIYNNAVSNLYTSRTSASATRYVFGIFVGVSSATSSQSYDIDNNTVSIGQGLNAAISSTCFEVQNNSAVYRIRGNIFANYSSANATARHYAVRFTGATWGAAGSVSNYNNYYIATDLGTSGFISLVNAAANSTLIAHQAALTSPASQDANSQTVDPQLTNPNTNLQASALALNNVTGFTVQSWVTDDILCAARGASPHDFGAYSITPVTLDMGATALVAPVTTGCYGATETVTVTVRNFGISTIDFSVNPTTVTVNVTGAVSATLTATLSSGTLAASGTQNVNMSSTLNMSTAGIYTFNAFTTVAGDGNATNDAMTATTRTVVAPVTLPQSVNFTGYTGADLTTLFPNWFEATGASAPSGTSSAWTSQSGWSPANTTAKINLYTTGKNDWIVGPKFVPTTGASLNYSIAITDYNTVGVDASGMQGTDDFVQVRISTDCGLSWTSLVTWNAANTTSISNTLVTQTLDLTPYAGQQCIIAFFASEGTTDDSPDYDFHIDNVSIQSVCTGTPSAGTSSVVSTAPYCAGTAVNMTNNAVNTGGGITYQWQVSTTSGSGYVNVSVGTGGTSQNYTTGPLAAGTYYYVLAVTCSGGPTTVLSNELTVVVIPGPTVGVSGGNLICGSGSVTLTASGASSYSWAPGGSTSNPLTASPTSTTTYTVTGTDGNSCTATSTHTVVVSNAVVITGTSATPSDVCNGGSTSLAVSVAGPAAYCSATANSTSYEKISNVSLNTINNTSSSTAGYEDFTAVNTSLAVGTPYSVSVTVSSAYASDDRVYIWVDLNQDGVFGDPSEKLYDGAVSTFCPSCSGSSSATLTGTLTIPGSAGNGTTRMRVRLQDNSASIPNTTPCGASSFGQVEDYTVNISGGVNAYSYSWSPATFLNNTTLASPTASGMTSSETYTVTVTNSAGCTATQSVSVNVYAPFTASANADNNVSCFGGNNGAATVSASGGSGSYSYSWAPSGGTLASASGLTAGIYTVTVTDASCGTTTASVTISEPSAVSITCTPTNPSCFGGNDGQVVVSASGGTGSISGTGTFTGLSASAYSYTVTDANGCTASCSGSLVDPPQLIASCVASDVSCPGGSNGSVTVSATGGTGAYTGTGTFGGLTAGSYNYTVTDANGCTASCSATVGTSGSNSVAPTGASASAANICLPNNVTLSVVGGSLGSGANWVWYAGACGAGAPIGTGASISYTPPSAGTYPFYVRAEGACNTTTCATVSVVVSGGQPTGTISITSAPASGCVGGSDVITTNSVLGATGYNWSGPPQVLFNGQPSPYVSATNSVTVSYSALPTGGQSGWNICVQAVNACGASPNTKCTWIRATLTQPSAITGNIIGCPSTVGTYSIPAVAGAASYQWTGTSGMTVVGTGTSATVTFGPGFTSGTLCVSGVTSCGYVGASRCMTISAAPAIPGTISGSSTICPGGSSSYSIAAVPGATSYIWSTTGSGVSVVGSGTSATVSTTSGFTAGSVCVVAVSACGANSAQRCKTISTGKLGTPGNITGDPTNGVCGQTYTYSIPAMSGATSYAWSLPSGATGSSSTNSITVTFSGGFTTGQICVNGVNGCGAGFQRCVTVNGNPSNVTGLTTSTPSPCMGTDILVTWNATNGASTYDVLVPVGYTVLSGTPTSNTFAIVNAGFSNGSIGIRANSSCGNSGTATLAITPVGCRVAGSADVAAALRTEVFPNPTTGTVNIRFNSENSDMQYVVNVTDLSGRVILSERNKASKGSNLHTLDLSGMAKGTYLVSLLTDNGKEVVRVTVE